MLVTVIVQSDWKHDIVDISKGSWLSAIALAMGPRKKARTGPGPQAPPSAPVASNINQVPLIQQDIAKCVELMYKLRHGVVLDPKKVDMDMLDLDCEVMTTVSDSTTWSFPEPGEDGNYPFPILNGGTFMEICQRAQANREWLLTESAGLCHAAGFLTTADVHEFEEKFLTMPDLQLCRT